MKLTHEITIGKYKVKHVNSVEVQKTINQIADVATIVLPKRANNKVWAIPPGIARGEKVTIKLGYDGENTEEFVGFVSGVKQTEQIEIKCEDYAFNVRKKVKNKQYLNISVGDLVRDVAGQVGMSAKVSKGIAGLKYGKFTIQDATAYEVLEKIKQEYSCHVFLSEKTIHVQLKYELNTGKVKYDFAKNVEKVNLAWERAEDKKVQVEVVGIDINNKKVSVKVGEEGGDTIKINRYNVMDTATLRAIGEEEMKKWKTTGYKGDLTGWLRPYCTYGMSAYIHDSDYPDRDGSYYVEAVTTSYSDAGGERKVNIGIQLN